MSIIVILFLEKSSEVVDSAKHAAHEANVKAHELKESAGEKLESAEKIGKYYFKSHLFFHFIFLIGEQKPEDAKQWLNEKGSEVKAKGAEILDATQHALASGAAAVTEKAKKGIELASDAASNVEAAAGHLASDAQAKVAETAHNAQGKYIYFFFSYSHFFI